MTAIVSSLHRLPAEKGSNMGDDIFESTEFTKSRAKAAFEGQPVVPARLDEQSVETRKECTPKPIR